MTDEGAGFIFFGGLYEAVLFQDVVEGGGRRIEGMVRREDCKEVVQVVGDAPTVVYSEDPMDGFGKHVEYARCRSQPEWQEQFHIMGSPPFEIEAPAIEFGSGNIPKGGLQVPLDHPCSFSSGGDEGHGVG